MTAGARKAPSYWQVVADRVLDDLYANGKRPTDKQVHDAYPFGVRRHWPYKVWLEHVKWWKAWAEGHAPQEKRKANEPLPGQEAML